MSYKVSSRYTIVSAPMEVGEMVFVMPKENVRLEDISLFIGTMYNPAN